MKKILFSLVFLIAFSGYSRDISGSWRWISSNDGDHFEINLNHQNERWQLILSLSQGGTRIDRLDNPEMPSINVTGISEKYFRGNF